VEAKGQRLLTGSKGSLYPMSLRVLKDYQDFNLIFFSFNFDIALVCLQKMRSRYLFRNHLQDWDRPFYFMLQSQNNLETRSFHIDFRYFVLSMSPELLMYHSLSQCVHSQPILISTDFRASN
jgi:hypothetical protein